VKLVIQIPCLNEEATLPVTVADLPRSVPGFDTVELLVIDDGSSDRTSEVARQLGAQRVVRFASHRGLARAFAIGLSEALAMGADVVVNTDADNQYRGADVEKLVRPIVDGRADMVVGERPRDSMAFSPAKRVLQRMGSAVVRWISGTTIPDATCGFRAYSKDAALQLNVFSTFSYTLETIIQLGLHRARIVSVPIGVNPVARPSRLFHSIPEFVFKQALTIVHIFVIYRPVEILAWPGLMLVLLGLLPGVRFLLLYLAGRGQGHVQSLILASLLLSTGVVLLLAAMIASVSAANRMLLEDLRLRLRRLETERTSRTPPE